MTKCVLDASAVLALLNQETGAEKVAAVLSDALMSAVNYCEVIGKLLDAGVSEPDARESVELLGIRIIDFDASHARAAAMLKRSTKSLGLSLGDRSCLALGLREKCDVVTAERSWAKLRTTLKIILIR